MSGMQWKKGSRAPIYMTVIRQRNQNWLLKDEKEFAKEREEDLCILEEPVCVKKLSNLNVILLFFFFPLGLHPITTLKK